MAGGIYFVFGGSRGALEKSNFVLGDFWQGEVPKKAKGLGGGTMFL